MKSLGLQFWLFLAAYACFSKCSAAPAQPQKGTTVGSKTLDTYGYDIEGKVRTAWIVPKVEDHAFCACRFNISNNGQLVDLKTKGQKMESFTKSCLDAIAKVAPFPPLPQAKQEARFVVFFSADAKDSQVRFLPTHWKPTENPQFADLEVLNDKYEETFNTDTSKAKVPDQNGVRTFVRTEDGLSPSSVAIEKLDFKPYIDSIQHKIEQAWAPPAVAQGQVSCLFTIGGSGKVQTLQFFSRRGIASEFIESATEAITKAEPYEKLPSGISYLSVAATFKKDGASQSLHAVKFLTDPMP